MKNTAPPDPVREMRDWWHTSIIDMQPGIIRSDEDVSLRRARRSTHRPFSWVAPGHFSGAQGDGINAVIFRAKQDVAFGNYRAAHNARLCREFPNELPVGGIESDEISRHRCDIEGIGMTEQVRLDWGA